MVERYTLYSYFRSSCSARVRIAAHLKGIELEYKFIQLLKNEQSTGEYAGLNPSHSVPTLVVSEDGKVIATIRQSVAILEYLEDTLPETRPLLPPLSNPTERAKVRELVGIVACDIQPVTNLRVLQQIKPAGIDANDWQQRFMTAGLKAYEALASQYSGKYSVGDEVTMADCTLAPAIDNALRFGVDIGQFPTISRLATEYEKVDAFVRGNWRNQPDTPEELRQK